MSMNDRVSVHVQGERTKRQIYMKFGLCVNIGDRFKPLSIFLILIFLLKINKIIIIFLNNSNNNDQVFEKYLEIQKKIKR